MVFETSNLFALRSHQLKNGMVLVKQLTSRMGMALLAADQMLTPPLIAKIQTYEKETGVNFLVFVREERKTATEASA
jgi:hypothetical protein